MRKKVDAFVHEAFHTGINTPERAKDLPDRFDAFCADNQVPFEISEIFTESGAGEMLWMMQGI